MNKDYGYVQCPLVDALTMPASVAHQNEMIARAAAVRGYDLRRVFIDIGAGTNMRTELIHLLERAAIDSVSAIVVATMSRLSRNRVDVTRLRKEFDGLGAVLISAEEEDISDEAYAFAWTR